ncbi:hypothetical protein ACFZC5_32735, partial [Nocardia gamkensis]|uniref:DoxX family protein n=1 Tax=Nocardia gamkensis TaxID=352869 RepID=UPI0036E173B4
SINQIPETSPLSKPRPRNKSQTCGFTWRHALGLTALFVVMLPANIYAAVSDIPFNGTPATPLWARIPEQALYIGAALWAAGVLRSSRRGDRDHGLAAGSAPENTVA